MNAHGLIVDEIERIAGVVNTRFMATDYPNLEDSVKGCMQGIRFDWGHPLEIVQRLQQYTKHDDLKFEKFPLIALYTDIKVSKHRYGDYDGVTLELVMCNATSPNYTSNERKIKSFIPVLRPMYGYFCEELLHSSVFSFVDDVQDDKHDATERYFWGKEGLYGNTANMFNDYVDAIHIQNLELKLNQNDC